MYFYIKMKEQLERLLKILTKRQLTDREIQFSREEKETNVRRFNILTKRKLYSRTNLEKEEELIAKKTLREYKTTPDVSHGWKMPHTGWYVFRDEMRTYTPKGQLLKRRVYDERRIGPGTRTTEYNPPGRFFGKKIDRDGKGIF